MKIKRTYKPELIVSREHFRLEFQNINLQKIRGKDCLVATDGRRLVALPVEREEGDTDGPIPPKSMQVAREAGNKRDPLQIKCNGKCEFVNGWTIPRPEQLKFPNVESVIPAEDRDGQICISLNAKFLYEIAKAMGRDEVSLYLLDGHSPIVVRPSGPREGELGVLMPVRNIND